MNKEIEAKIEYEEVIGEANAGGYQPVRFTRVKYKASPQPHIDIRKYQRGYGKNEEECFYPTKTGVRFLESEFRRVVKQYTLMPETYIHPIVVKMSFSLLNQKQFESAVLQAFKVVETMLRKVVGAGAEEFGVSLIRKAFHPENGPLTDTSLPISEREALSNYMAGAYGYYKNPCSHREVEMDFMSAFSRIVVASDLVRTIENASQKHN